MENGKFKIGDDGEIEPILDDGNFEEKRKRKTKRSVWAKFFIPLALLAVLLTTGFIFTRSEYQLFACRTFGSCSLIPYEPFYMRAPLCTDSPVISDAKIVFAYRPLYEWEQTEDIELFVQDVNSPAICRLTDNRVDETQPVWSFDGQRIAYVSKNTFESVVNTVHVDGSNQDTAFAGFPDGYINFMRPEWSSANYELMVSDDQKQTRVKNDTTSLLIPYPISQDRTWSANGEEIAFIYEDDLFIGQKEEARRIVIDHFYGLTRVAWIPDSRKVVFPAQQPGINGNVIVMVDVDSGETTALPLELTETWIKDSRISPDGTKVALQLQYVDENAGIYDPVVVMSLADGSTHIALKQAVGYGELGFWMGDSQSMVFIDYPGINIPAFKIIDLNNPSNSRVVLSFNHSTMGMDDFDVWSRRSS